MPNISNDFVLGALIGYFLQNSLIVFVLGLASGVVIVERYGSVSNIFSWLMTHSTDNIREIVSLYLKKKPVEKNTVEKID